MIAQLADTLASAAASADRCVAIAASICSVGILIQSLEIAWHAREFPRRRLLGWRGSGKPARSAAAQAVRWLHQPPAVLIILLGRAVAAGAILLGRADGPELSAALTVLLLGQIYYNRRFYDLASDADAIFLACLTGLWVVSLPGVSDWLRAAGLLFVALQVLLAYFGTGRNKLTSPAWRDGERLRQIFEHGAHGFAPLGRLFSRWPALATLTAWSVIVLELAFPLGLFLPDHAFLVLLGAGLCFHGAVAFTMGLHDFFWAFAAGYPALWFAHELIGR